MQEDDASLIKKIHNFIKNKDVYSLYALSESGVSIIPAIGMQDAAEKVVKAALG